MVNIVFFGGTGRMGEDCEFKYCVAKYLPNDWSVTVVSRVKDAKKWVEDDKRIKFQYTYDNEIFKRKLTLSEIEDAEKWLGHPLKALKHYSRYVKDIKNKKKEEKILEFAAKHVIFWKNYFEENETNVFTTTLVSEIPATVPFLATKKAGIKAINIIMGRITNSQVLANADYDMLEWNRESYKESEIDGYYNKIKEEYESRKEVAYAHVTNEVLRNLSILSPDICIKKTRQLKEFIEFRQKNKIEACMECPKSFISQYLKSISRKIIVPSLFKPLEKDKKFFFYPLHYPIDAQLLYRAPFIDQYALIEQISHCLPYNTVLYIKSHPHYSGTDVDYKMMKELSKISNIRVISPSVNPYYLMSNAAATFTINSTAGYEAIFLDAPLITFGDESYARDGVSIVAKDLKKLPNIIFKLLDDPNYGRDINKRREFVYKLLKNTIRLEGVLGLDYVKFTEKDGKNIADAIVKAYDNYKIL